MLAVKSEFFWRVVVFFCGLVVGSFLNVLVYRLPRGLGFVKGRSFCPKCKKKIAWFDNIPLLSFFLLRGKCRRCKKQISIRYPLVELLTGVLTILIFNFKFEILNQYQILNFEFLIDFVLILLLFWGLVVIFFVDLEHQIIPDEIIIPLIIIFLLREFISFFFLSPNPYNLSPIFSAVGAFLFFFLIYLATKGKGMGFGDVKLAFLMGLALGWPRIILAFYLAFLTGALTGVILILRKKAKLKQKIAFGPFLALATVISILWGEKIISRLVLLL